MGVFRLSFYKWLIVGCLTFSAKYFLHNQDENKLTNTYMNYTKIRGEWDNQDENKLTNTYMNYKKIRGEWDNQLNRLPLEMHSALNMEDQNSL
jgi:hypothetical protein